jgi:hypothetical protein
MIHRRAGEGKEKNDVEFQVSIQVNYSCLSLYDFYESTAVFILG